MHASCYSEDLKESKKSGGKNFASVVQKDSCGKTDEGN
jgi:hypothetical protein